MVHVLRGLHSAAQRANNASHEMVPWYGRTLLCSLVLARFQQMVVHHHGTQ